MCDLVLAEIGTGVPEGGSSIPAPLSDLSKMVQVVVDGLHKLALQARRCQVWRVWRRIAEPWMNAAKPRLTSATSIPIAWPTAAVAEHSVEQTVVAQPPSVHPVVAANGLAERIVGRLPTEPWQNKADDKRSNLWQAVAQRRRMHRRHTNQSLGVCSLDLRGPHEATPTSWPSHG